MRVVVTGAPGTIGTRLLAALDAEVTVLTHNTPRARRKLNAARFVAWDGRAAIAPSVFDGADIVYHLAGEPVAGGGSGRRRRRSESSTVARSGTRRRRGSPFRQGTLEARPREQRPAVRLLRLRRGDELFDSKKSNAGVGISLDVSRAWEAEAAQAERHGRGTRR